MGVGLSPLFRRFAPSIWTRAGAALSPAAAWAAFAGAWTADRDRRPLWLPVGLGAGIALYFALSWEPARWLGAATLATGAVLAMSCWRLGDHARLRALAAMAAALLIGFGVAKLRTDAAAAPFLHTGSGQCVSRAA